MQQVVSEFKKKLSRGMPQSVSPTFIHSPVGSLLNVNYSGGEIHKKYSMIPTSVDLNRTFENFDQFFSLSSFDGLRSFSLIAPIKKLD